jgi:mono/diheme cytochrome c family protein/rhodanese-related sulfurtransferase
MHLGPKWQPQKNSTKKMKKILLSQIAFLTFFGLILSCTSEHNKELSNSQVKELNNRSLLGLGFGITDVNLIVKDLLSVRNYYADVLGFKMPLPEKFENGILNGTLTTSANFPDMSSIQLLAIKDTALVSVKHSFLQRHKGVGLYSLSTSSTDTTLQWLSLQGFKMDSLRSGRTTTKQPKGWDGDSGGPEWRSVDFNSKNHPAYFPNYVEYVGFPYQEYQANWKYVSSQRKYDDFNHPNGVVGIVALRIAVIDLKTARKEFKKMGLTELKVNDSLTLASFKIAHNQELHLVIPKSPNDELTNFLKIQGSGVFAAIFEVKKLKHTHEFFRKRLPAKALRIETSPERLIISKEYASGVQLEFMEESKEQASLAQVYSFKRGSKLDTASIRYAFAMYVKNCATCHRPNRKGGLSFGSNFAPSLRSHSLMATAQSFNYLNNTISYGRQGTAMAGYSKNHGGSLTEADIELLSQWLYELSGVEKPIELSTEAVTGNEALGKAIYEKRCATCHGLKGEGNRAPALGNPMLLATASDAFIRYAISEGRDNTLMQSFKDTLSNAEIDALTAFLRSRVSGWSAPEAVTEPPSENYVIYPHSKTPKFELRENQYVSLKQLRKALQDSSRLVILDARSKMEWRQAHIPGAISVPYHEDPDTFTKQLPNDSTWIIAYCSRPQAESKLVANTLKRFGYKNIAILDEGILAWIKNGYPIQYGQDNKKGK